MFVFVRINISPYPHKPDCHKLDKRFPKKIFVKSTLQHYFEISLSRSYTKILNKIFEQSFYQYVIYNLRTANMDL